MPYNWNDEWIPSAADNKADIIGMGDIGGIGQLIYHTFVFRDYEYDYTDIGGTCLRPIISKSLEESIVFNTADSGKELFCAVYNLAKRIDDISERRGAFDLIRSFCKGTAFPYHIDEIYAAVKEGLITSNFELENFERHYMFDIQTFLNDLGKFYAAANFYFALKDLYYGTGEMAYNLVKSEGKFFSQLPFFERYKSPELPIGPAAGDAPSAPTDILEEMIADNAKAEPATPGGDWFAREPIDHYVELVRTLCEIMPDFRLRLKTDPAKNKIVFAADVHSVFDIAWFVLAHMVAEIDPPTEFGKEQELSEGTLITCMHCGEAFIRRSNRQLFCLKKECRNAHNAQRQQQYRDRKKRQETKQE